MCVCETERVVYLSSLGSYRILSVVIITSIFHPYSSLFTLSHTDMEEDMLTLTIVTAILESITQYESLSLSLSLSPSLLLSLSLSLSLSHTHVCRRSSEIQSTFLCSKRRTRTRGSEREGECVCVHLFYVVF